MTDPVMDKIEQDLRAMSEESTDSTHLWKRALEVSRADERSSLVHPGRDSEFESKPTRGRRLFLTLNAVGVAAMVALAAGVWTIAASSPSPVEETLDASQADRLAMPEMDTMQPMPEMAKMDDMPSMAPMPSLGRQLETIADASPNESTDSGLSRDEPRARLATQSRQARSNETLRESAPVEGELADALADDSMEAFSDLSQESLNETSVATTDQPGLAQTHMALEDGIVLGLGNGTIFGSASTTLPAIESAHIVIEVDNIDEAFVAVSDLPDAEQDEFSTLGLAIDDSFGDELTLNLAPARLDETLAKIRSLGTVVKETRSRDSQYLRTNAAMNFAAEQIAPQQAVLEELYLYNNMSEHERSHQGIDLDEDKQIASLNFAVTELSRQLENARRSLNLSRLRVSIVSSKTSDETEE